MEIYNTENIGPLEWKYRPLGNSVNGNVGPREWEYRNL